MVSFSPEPIAIEEGQVTFHLTLSHRQSAVVRLLFAIDGHLKAPQGAERFVSLAKQYRLWTESATRIRTDNEFFNAVLERSLADLRMLWHQEDDRCYLAAGTPWFDTLFGRDTAIASMQTLAFNPDIARHCLKMLARWQGTRFDDWRDEEPGKILHELREDEMTATGELPFSPYYGSVDSTPLFLLLAAEYYPWTGRPGAPARAGAQPARRPPMGGHLRRPGP